MLICYTQAGFVLEGIQSCLCCLYNLKSCLKNPHFYLLFYVDGHFNVMSVKHKLNFTDKVCQVNVFANRNSANNLFLNGFIILIIGSSNILKSY